MINLLNSDRFRFKDEGHIHEMLDGEWVEVPGCTSVSGLYSQDGWKFAWPPKLMYEKAMETFGKDELISFNVKAIDAILKTSKNAWREKRDKSADTGVKGHDFISKYILEIINGHIREYEDDVFGFGIDRIGNFKHTPLDKEIYNILEQFGTWNNLIKPKWLASEVQVGSLTHKFCGILDALAEIDGKVVLVDFKTGAVKHEANIQIAGLCLALEEQGIKVDERAILHLPKSGSFNYVEIKSDLEFEKKAFISGLDHLRFKNIFLSKEVDKRKGKVV